MRSEGSMVRVGATVIAGLVLFGITILVIGEKDSIFTRKTEYFIHFESVSGLSEGNPVQLNGVHVGTVARVVLPEDTGETLLQVWITIESRYSPRIREDSIARIQTLGVLGDRFIAVTSGHPSFDPIEAGGEISAAPVTNVDTLIASGGDAVDNIVATAAALSKILGRIDRGEGVLGQLLAKSGSDENLLAHVEGTLESLASIAKSIDEGAGPLGRLIHDEELADELDVAFGRLSSVLSKVDEGNGLLAALLDDPTSKERFDSTLESLEEASHHLSALAEDFDTGEGLLPTLLRDQELSREITNNLRTLLDQLNLAAAKLTEGDGTAARLLNDPDAYEALNDILIGVNESSMLRWLIRNRQKKGIETRYEEAQKASESSP